MAFVASIVEGHGEVDALPTLVRRLAQELKGTYPRINPPFRVRASSFVKLDAEFERAVKLSAAQAKQNEGVVLILLDCEDDCAATVGPRILAGARSVRDDVPYVVCLAIREYETWLIHGSRSLAGVEGLPVGIGPPDSPERMRDAKGWLRDQMGRKYLEREHQEAFTAKVDLNSMMESDSFRRLADRLLPYL